MKLPLILVLPLLVFSPSSLLPSVFSLRTISPLLPPVLAVPVLLPVSLVLLFLIAKIVYNNVNSVCSRDFFSLSTFYVCMFNLSKSVVVSAVSNKMKRMIM